jgi:hypothetical protein
MSAELEFRVHVTDAVTPGVLAIGVNVHRNRAMLSLTVDELTGDVTVAPARIEVEKAARVAAAHSENRSVWV